MSIAASLLSIALFLAFATAGLQKVVFNPTSSRTAEHLGYSRRGYQRIGAVEVVLAVALLVGLASKRASVLGITNEVAAGLLVVLSVAMMVIHRRHSETLAQYAPYLVLGGLALVALVTRVV